MDQTLVIEALPGAGQVRAGAPRLTRSGEGPTIARVGLGFGQYELLDNIGAGGMAEVWKARRLLAGDIPKDVALKILNKTSDPESRQRALREELRLSAKLRHSNIVQVSDGGRINGRDYLEMEWVEGVDLAALLKWSRQEGTPLAVDVIEFILGELLRALEYAHTLPDGPIIHRDISPHNVLISVAGEVKLTDFRSCP